MKGWYERRCGKVTLRSQCEATRADAAWARSRLAVACSGGMHLRCFRPSISVRLLTDKK